MSYILLWQSQLLSNHWAKPVYILSFVNLNKNVNMYSVTSTSLWNLTSEMGRQIRHSVLSLRWDRLTRALIYFILWDSSSWARHIFIYFDSSWTMEVARSLNKLPLLPCSIIYLNSEQPSQGPKYRVSFILPSPHQKGV